MKYLLILVLLIPFNFVFASSWDELLPDCNSDYSSKYKECFQANDPKGWSWPRSIEEFVCINSTDKYEILPQIILDVEFKKIDKKVESYLAQLENNKEEFFWPSAKRSLVEWVKEVDSKFSIWDDNSFWKEYMNICWDKIVSETVKCFWSIPDDEIQPYYKDQTCKKLVLTKLDVFSSVAYNILKLNKNQVKKDLAKKNSKQRRTKYDKLLDIIMINIWYVERIRQKWPSKTKNPHK